MNFIFANFEMGFSFNVVSINCFLQTKVGKTKGFGNFFSNFQFCYVGENLYKKSGFNLTNRKNLFSGQMFCFQKIPTDFSCCATINISQKAAQLAAPKNLQRDFSVFT